jgi:putative ubiquitin-RnfH superfamily antitoxin RatB of RatAB toxin-antitoxin module
MAPDDATPALPQRLRIEVVYCPTPGAADRSQLTLPAGSTLADALRASGVLARHGLGTADAPALSTGIWCMAADPSTPLRDRDRVELYRGLMVDPKEARRLRYKRRAR